MPINPFGVRLISAALHKTLFGQAQLINTIKPDVKLAALDHLSKFGIKPDQEEILCEEESLKLTLPHLYGDVESHFEKIARAQIQPYVRLAQGLAAGLQSVQMPCHWHLAPGWTRYPFEKEGHKVDFVLENCFVFDVEVCVSQGKHPVIATALSNEAWYSWCSPHLVQGTSPSSTSDLDPERDLIKVDSKEDEKARLIVGHNVSYDRARCSQQYGLRPSKTRFLDTMALHIAVSGMTSGQRSFVQASKKSETNNDNTINEPKWLGQTSLNNLKDVYQLYCNPVDNLDKETRSTFMTATLPQVREDLQKLMTYCANDVLATQKTFGQLFPLFRSRCPHPATLSGMLTMGMAYLPVGESWPRYIQQAEEVAQEQEEDVGRIIGQQAKEACQLLHGDKYEKDLWMWDQDWTCSQLKVKKKKKVKKDAIDPDEDKFKNVMESVQRLYKNQPRCPGYPKWYDALCQPYQSHLSPTPQELGTGKAIVPKLLRLMWMGYPLYKHKTEKWGYLSAAAAADPNDHDDISGRFPTSVLLKHLGQDHFVHEPPDYRPPSVVKKKKPYKAEKEEVMCPEEAPGCQFTPLPHKDGNDLRVGNPLSKHYLDKVRDGVLSAQTSGLAERVLVVAKRMSYWKSNRDRINDQMVVGQAIIPQIVAAGTLTRRAVERTWLTASNAKVDRIGSELKAMVQAPPGYSFVGADVDSQELWIAAVIGDSHFSKEHGSTALGWMTLQGTKSQGTDLHSATARSVGVSRDEAKVLNYGRIYGAGVPFAKQLLRNFNPRLEEDEASRLAAKMYAETKGERTYVLNDVGSLCYKLAFGTGSDCKEWVVTRREMSKLVTMKRKLDMFVVTDLSKNVAAAEKFVLNDEGYGVMMELGLDFKEDLSLEELRHFVSALGRVAVAKGTHHEWFNSVKQLTKKTLWDGGSESHTFNRLEEIALAFAAKTPVLGCRISRVLESEKVGIDYLPSRINWVVQSSAVDYLHLLLVAMQWLMDVYAIDGRFVISIHDEVRYLVKYEDRYRAALALQVANLLVRAMFCRRLGMNSLPRDVAFFSAVDIDQVMRKDPLDECVTPSNPLGLTQGYGVPPGECLNLRQLLEKLSN